MISRSRLPLICFYRFWQFGKSLTRFNSYPKRKTNGLGRGRPKESLLQNQYTKLIMRRKHPMLWPRQYGALGPPCVARLQLGCSFAAEYGLRIVWQEEDYRTTTNAPSVIRQRKMLNICLSDAQLVTSFGVKFCSGPICKISRHPLMTRCSNGGKKLGSR